MKAKTIQKVLRAKHAQLVDSITDPEVSKIVDKQSIITGGCIASMLLREPINDFDFYFRTKESAAAVAKYYVGLFNKSGTDFSVIEEDDRVKILIQSAGVASMNDEEADASADDLLSQIEELDERSADEVDTTKPKARPAFISANAITLSDKFQIIVRFYGEPEEIHSNYDFEHCMSYWTSWDEKLVLNPRALEALLTKELRYVGSKYPLCSIIRTRKFIARGWNINAGQYLKMAMQLNELDLKNLQVLEDQLTGVDAAYFMILIAALKEQDPEKVNSAYISTIIDRIF